MVLPHSTPKPVMWGNEINAITKDPSQVEVSIALAFPDVYEWHVTRGGQISTTC